jgi:hypothetical protein
MRKLLLIAALFAVTATVGATPLTQEAIDAVPDKKVPSKEIESNLPDSHPMAYILYAAKLFRAGKQDLGTRWYYVGQIRFNHYLLANPDLPADADPAVLASVNKNYGPAITDWSGGNIRIWLQNMKDALAWDAANPNNFTSKETHAAELEQARAQISTAYDTIKRTQETIRNERKSRGLVDR